MNEESFLLENFRRFYKKNPVTEPPWPEQREFGIGGFGKKISQRHLAFGSLSEFNLFLQKEAPLFVSSSVSYYARPASRPMQAKGWLGADLVFEFDSDDIKTDCKREHDSWACKNCGTTGKGSVQNCSNCGEGVKAEEWVCPECLSAVKKQAVVLLDWIQNDLGLDDGIALNFSGSKGFHVHVRSGSVKSLSPAGRIELLDFLTGHGLELESVGFAEKNKSVLGPRLENAKGWNRRILEKTLGLILNGSAEQIAVAGNISVRTAEKIVLQKQSAAEQIKKGFFPAVTASKSNLFWKSVFESAIGELKLDVDRQTSVDVYKIVRVAGTLHGSTGLSAKAISIDELAGFDGLTQGVVFDESPVELAVSKTPRFWLKNQWWGPFDNETQKLPLYAAVFLVGRGKATLGQSAEKK
ncbi:MAG: DNA primase small subunit domain-containing protein [Candidatus Micrarchaeota archaeon]